MNINVCLLLLVTATSCCCGHLPNHVPKCVKERHKLTGSGHWIPECTNGGTYKPKQCDSGVCWCVKTWSGRPAYNNQQVPLGETYDCTNKPTDCERERFAAIFKGATEDCTPECDKKGLYTKPVEHCKFTVPEGCEVDNPNPHCENLALHKRAIQSGSFRGAGPCRAVDGNTDQTWDGRSCAATEVRKNPWWSVDLGHLTQVYRVDLTNWLDCCPERLSMLRIGTTNVSPLLVEPDLTNFEICATFDGTVPAGETMAFECTTRGRYLIVQMERTDCLIICEARVYGEQVDPDVCDGHVQVPDGCGVCNPNPSCKNLAQYARAYQSGITDGGKAGRAVDGNISPYWNSLSCSMTSKCTNPWWAVDLGRPTQLFRVDLTNRADCCSERMNNLRIGTTNTSPLIDEPQLTNYELCAVVEEEVPAGQTRAFECMTKGRYLIIQMVGKAYLTICEMAVYGETRKCEEQVAVPQECAVCNTNTSSTNIALHKRTWQSGQQRGGVSSRAVDGNAAATAWAAHSCTMTEERDNPWWAVDLGRPTQVFRVDVTNRVDCCPERLRMLRIGTTNTSPLIAEPALTNFDRCATFDGMVAAGETHAFECTTKGRYLVIQMEAMADVLTICEVSVCGEQVDEEIYGQLAFWPLSQTYGGQNMVAGSSDLTLINMAWIGGYNTQWASAPAQFDGSSFAQIVNVAGSAWHGDIMIRRSFSWMAALYWECHDNSVLIEFDDGNQVGTHIWIYQNKLYVNLIYEHCPHQNMFFSSHIKQEQWYIVAVAFDFDSKVISMWVDGNLEQKQAGPCSDDLKVAPNLRLGKRLNEEGRFFEGRMTCMSLYDRALSYEDMFASTMPFCMNSH